MWLILFFMAWAQTAPAAPASSALDFAVYKAKVEPLFLEKRPGHARCVVCHSTGTNFRLQQLSAGQKAWTEEQSRRNFANASTLVDPGDPATSRLLLQPLAPEGGGNAFHSGGRQFASKSDPDWNILAQWVNGAKLKAPRN